MSSGRFLYGETCTCVVCLEGAPCHTGSRNCALSCNWLEYSAAPGIAHTWKAAGKDSAQGHEPAGVPSEYPSHNVQRERSSNAQQPRHRESACAAIDGFDDTART